MKPNKNIKGLIIGALIVVTGIILVVRGKSIATEDSTILRDQTVDNLDFKTNSDFLKIDNNIAVYDGVPMSDNAIYYVYSRKL